MSTYEHVGGRGRPGHWGHRMADMEGRRGRRRGSGDPGSHRGERGERGERRHGDWSPWDPRGGFGPGFRPPFRGRRAARGDIRASVLALVAEQPMHGYQIITELVQRSNGAWRPSPGSVYPILQQLQDEGLVRVEETDGRRVVHLTDAGREYVDAHPDELAAPWEAVGGRPDEQTRDLMDALRGLAGAAWQVAQAGSLAQLERATALLADTRRRLYGILAENGGTAGADPDDDKDAPGDDA